MLLFWPRKTATFLPKVPGAQGWDKVQTIDSLLRKGGHKGAVTPELRRGVRLVRYQSELLSCTYQDYLHHCRWKPVHRLITLTDTGIQDAVPGRALTHHHLLPLLPT